MRFSLQLRLELAFTNYQDTCSIHPSISGYETVNKIRALSKNLGIVRNFRAYADLVDLRIPGAFQLRSELQSSGVSLVDCPASERGSISSKTMIGECHLTARTLRMLMADTQLICLLMLQTILLLQLSSSSPEITTWPMRSLSSDCDNIEWSWSAPRAA